MKLNLLNKKEKKDKKDKEDSKNMKDKKNKKKYYSLLREIIKLNLNETKVVLVIKVPRI